MFENRFSVSENLWIPARGHHLYLSRENVKVLTKKCFDHKRFGQNCSAHNDFTKNYKNCQVQKYLTRNLEPKISQSIKNDQ